RDIVFDGQRVIDVERLAALVAAAAFDSLGDAYSILAFSSDGAADVRLTTIKDFSETNTQVVRERMAALAPNGKTRLGAAIRHATAQLERHGAPHRLLLVLSDGKPNDRDGYFLDYGVEDSRRAVVDARADGILPYCITVDREAAADYMADIFGASGYLTVQKPAQLPKALLGAVQRLLSH
ncbi:MAG: VWA domain-containing protein, partial [bacterium]